MCSEADESDFWSISARISFCSYFTLTLIFVTICIVLFVLLGFPGGSEVKVSACNEGDTGSIPGLGRSLGEGNGNPLQYSCLENPMDGGAWWATVHGVAKSQTQLSDFNFTFTFSFVLYNFCVSKFVKNFFYLIHANKQRRGSLKHFHLHTFQ